MHEFVDGAGQAWSAAVVERTGPDYKGRFVLQMTSKDGSQVLTLPEVAWNSARSAQRTLDTMSDFELRRRLRAAERRENPVCTP